MLRDITVLLSAIGSPTMPGQLACYRTNGERHIRIVGIDMNDDPSIKYLVDSFYQVPPVNHPKYCDIVLDICKKEHVDIYFPNISAEVELISKRQSDFCSIGTIVSIGNPESVEIANNKLKTYELLHKNGVVVPTYYRVDTIEDFVRGCKELGYPDNPVCIKMVNNSGSRGVRIIDSKQNRYHLFAHEKPNSLFTTYDDMLSILQSVDKIDQMMLVEYMPGNEYTVDLLASRGTVLYIAGRENLVSMMSIALESVVSKIESAYQICHQIVKILELDGNVGFDFMKNSDGIPMLTDINPRLTATVSVIAAAGLNLPYLRIKQLLGEDLPVCKINYGTRLKRRYGEMYTDSKGHIITLA